MINKYASTCHYCAAEVLPREGKCWRWNGRWYARHADCSRESCRATTDEPIDMEDGSEEGEARAKRALLRRNADRYVSHVSEFGGREYYQNKSGRCIDAPCCGCCTI